MQINIKTSEANRQRVTDLTGRIGGSTRLSENVVARIALSYSLARGNRLNIETDVQDSKGKEYTNQILLGKTGRSTLRWCVSITRFPIPMAIWRSISKCTSMMDWS